MNRPYEAAADADERTSAVSANEHARCVTSPALDSADPIVHLPRSERRGSGSADPLEMLASIMEALTGSASLPDRMDLAARQLRQAFGADACVLRSLEHGDLRLLGSSGLPSDQVRVHIPSQWSIAGELLSSLRPIRIADLAANPLTASVDASPSESSPFSSFAGAPLVAAGRPVGILGLYFSQTHDRLDAIDLDAMRIIADSIALAVDRDRMARLAETQREELEQKAEERRDLEVELLHAQKLETVGRLASQVVHDFNNMLTIVMNFNAVLRDELDPADENQEYLEKIAAACMQSAWLTRQLLAFANKETDAPAPVRLHPMIRDAAQMMVGTLGPRIHVEIEVFARNDTVLVSAGQLQNVLINLMVNARDAMSGAGTLTLRLDSRVVDCRDREASGGLAPGAYVCLQVSDTGCGMTEEVRRRVFDPYFTTKAPGKGTGLGLATCRSAIQQNRGDIHVESAPEKGSTFRILLPCADLPAAPGECETGSSGSAAGCETILLVEGRLWLREAAAGGLRRLGYAVHDADSGREALEVALAFADQISAVVTETSLPDMSGRELGDRLASLYPCIRVLFVESGRDLGAVDGAAAKAPIGSLAKPYTPESLARKLRELLDASGSVPQESAHPRET